MIHVLTRLAGLLVFAAGCGCVRAIGAVIGWVYEAGPAAGPAWSVAIFIAGAFAVFALIIVTPPLILGGLYALVFRLRD